MNERIKELAEQAGWGKGEIYDDCMTCSPFDPERFAQLIVKECADVVQKQKMFNNGYDRKQAIKQDALLVGYDDCATDIIRGLKEHFGVE